jgi:ribosomal protein S27AE
MVIETFVWLLYGFILRGMNPFVVTRSQGTCPNCGGSVTVYAHPDGRGTYWHQDSNVLVNYRKEA